MDKTKISLHHPLVAILFALLSINQAQALEPLPNDVKGLRTYLDVVNFDVKEQQKLELLEKLIPHSESLASANPKDAGFLMMAGFFNGQYAGATGGLGALKYAKAARDYLEKSTEIDPSLYGASALCVLSTIYYQVPGWPVGFGSKKSARKLIERAISISPTGMDANMTYATFLYNESEFEKSKEYFLRAQNAPARPDRPKADAELHKQIAKALELLEEKLQQ